MRGPSAGLVFCCASIWATHIHYVSRCLLSAVKRTSRKSSRMSAYEPKRTLSEPTRPLGQEVAVQVQFWGTRGSIPKPGPTTIHYGGNTLCHEIRTAHGTVVIIDCGSGLHGLG